jgi:hypothetical protein
MSATNRNLAGLAAGTLFGFGLAVSQMINPNKVLDFLDLFGDWDPSLAFVMGCAVAVTAIGFPIVLRWERPLFSGGFSLPTSAEIDRPLLLGATIFGIGWGLAGYCPGPVLSALVLGIWEPAVFILALLLGSNVYRWQHRPNRRL